jgi:hypothetical protein
VAFFTPGPPPLPTRRLRCEKRLFLRHLYIKCIILPRQARDKHREKLRKEWRLSSGDTYESYDTLSYEVYLSISSANVGVAWTHDLVWKTRSWDAVLRKSSCCQDRLGTNIGKTQTRDAFFLRVASCLRAITERRSVTARHVGNAKTHSATYLFCDAILYYTKIAIILPRQARDEHRESAENRRPYTQVHRTTSPRSTGTMTKSSCAICSTARGRPSFGPIAATAIRGSGCTSCSVQRLWHVADSTLGGRPILSADFKR